MRILDAHSGQLVRSVHVGPDARALAVDSSAGRVYAGTALAGCPGGCPGTDGVLTALDARSGRILRVLAPHVEGLTQLTMALDGQAKRLVVAGSSYNGPGRINLLDTASGRLLHTVPLAAGVWDAPVIVPATKRAFIAVGTDSSTGTTGALDVIDTTTGRLIRTVPLPGGMVHLAVDESARRVLVTTFGPAYRAVFTLSGGGGIAEMSPTGPGRLLILDARSGALVRSIPTGWGTTALAVDTRRGRVFVTSCGPVQPSGVFAGGGTLTVVDERRGTIVRRIAVGVDPTALAFDARTRHLFIAYQGNLIPPPTPDPWGWLPGWLSHKMPALPRVPARPPAVSGGISILDTMHL